MNARETRNLGVMAAAIADGSSVRTTYTNLNGKTARRDFRPVSIDSTGKGIRVTVIEGDDNVRTLNLSRAYRTIKRGK